MPIEPSLHITGEPARLVVLVSGNGSNLQAVLDACKYGRVNGQVEAVFSNRQDAYGLVRAQISGIPAIWVPKLKSVDRWQYDAELAERVAAYRPDWVLLLGWLRLFSAAFLDRFPGRVINLHPALPGAFPGTQAIERAFEAYRQGKIDCTGIMVHLVPDEGVDNGPLLGQASVPIHPQDDLEALEKRIHQTEHVLLISVLEQLLITRT